VLPVLLYQALLETVDFESKLECLRFGGREVFLALAPLLLIEKSILLDLRHFSCQLLQLVLHGFLFLKGLEQAVRGVAEESNLARTAGGLRVRDSVVVGLRGLVARVVTQRHTGPVPEQGQLHAVSFERWVRFELFAVDRLVLVLAVEG
jgi:hypothetical protein